jgi:hypothetical protein
MSLIFLAALNWPHHRGTATAFPLAAFGLSAFFYTMVSRFAFPGNTSSLLLFLSIGTSCLVFISVPFLTVVDRNARYAVLPTSEDFSHPARRDLNQLHRTKSGGSKHSGSILPQEEPGMCQALSYISAFTPGQLPNMLSSRRQSNR